MLAASPDVVTVCGNSEGGRGGRGGGRPQRRAADDEAT